MTDMLSAAQWPLPGMEHMPRAKPHEQTESQFQNRPDVFVHGRYMHPDSAENPPEVSEGTWDFHAGSRKAAHERLDSLGVPHTGTTPRFLYGRVNPHEMENTPNLGQWEGKTPVGFKYASPPAYSPHDPGRIVDQGEEWHRDKHANRYYRNDWEDRGSTSVLIDSDRHREFKRTPGGMAYHVDTQRPQNFTTWRQSVSNALQNRQRVPAHVRAAYEASGGEHGPQANVDTEYQVQTPPRQPGQYERHDQPITGFTSTKDMATYSGTYEPPF